jgi:inorganic triphosphatase YgiF
MAAIEIELKLAVARADVAALVRRLARYGEPATARVESVYFDTPDRRLAAAGCALRLRRAGDRWVQTLKCGTATAALARRGEWEVAARVVAGRPRLTRAAFARTPAAALLGRRARLDAVFDTRFERRLWQIEYGGARLEAALDTGTISAGRRREPICELELELKAGPAAALPEFALQLAGTGARALALMPYGESKSARGYRLAARAAPQPVKAQARRLTSAVSADTGIDAALRAVCARATEIVIANAHGALARDDPEFVHQARVAMRRLRSAARLTRRWVAFPPELAGELRWIARRLGAVRDCDVLVECTLPAIEREVGLPAQVRVRAQRERERARRALRVALASPRFARLALAALAWSAQPPRPDAPSLRAVAAASLARLHARLFDSARRFETLSVERQHRVRIRAKRLRYALDFFAATLPRRAVADYARRLAALQDDLGALNDIAVAAARLPALASAHRVRAAVRAWAQGARARHVHAAARALKRLRTRAPPWR